MKKQSMCRKRWMVLLLGVMFSLSLSLTGCMEEEAGRPGNDPGENWWDHPGQTHQTVDHDAKPEEDFEWWNVLDDTWTQEDWEEQEDGVWMIYDEETECTYAYDEESQDFAALDHNTEEVFMLDQESGEWIPAE